MFRNVPKCSEKALLLQFTTGLGVDCIGCGRVCHNGLAMDSRSGGGFCDIAPSSGREYHRTARPWRDGTAPRGRDRREENHREMNIKSTNKRIYDYIRRLRHTKTGISCYSLSTNLDRPRCGSGIDPLILPIPGYGPPPGPWRGVPLSPSSGGDVAVISGPWRGRDDKPKDSAQYVSCSP